MKHLNKRVKSPLKLRISLRLYFLVTGPKSEQLPLPGKHTCITPEMSLSVAFDVNLHQGRLARPESFDIGLGKESDVDPDAVAGGGNAAFFCINCGRIFSQVLKESNKNPVNETSLTVKSNSCQLLTLLISCSDVYSERAFCQSQPAHGSRAETTPPVGLFSLWD